MFKQYLYFLHLFWLSLSYVQNKNMQTLPYHYFWPQITNKWHNLGFAKLFCSNLVKFRAILPKSLEQDFKYIYNIEFNPTQTQTHKYLLTYQITNRQKGWLFNLKCETVRGLIGNFSQMYFGDIQCRLTNSASDSQCHLLLCPVLKELISWGGILVAMVMDPFS